MTLLKMDKKSLKNLDWILISTSILIVLFGILNIYSTTHNTAGMHYGELQMLWLVISLLIGYLIINYDYKLLSNYAPIIYWLSVAILILVLTLQAVKGATSWIRIGSISIEPGEFIRISLALMLGKKIHDMDCEINKFKNLFKLIIYALIPIILIIKQPNIGMALICFSITLSILFISGLDTKVMIGGFLSIVPICFLIWNSGIMKEYQKARITAFINPGAYEQDISYQLVQSITGIGSGGILGTGFLKSTIASQGFIPEIHTDFIFAVVGEEWGLIGALVLLLLYSILLYRILKISRESKDILGRTISVGIFASFTFSIFQNIGMTIGIMPIAGITLPFMSYGGSSLLANFIALALVLNIGIRKYKINF